jgi:hypothetical protein
MVNSPICHKLRYPCLYYGECDNKPKINNYQYEINKKNNQ